MFAGRMYPEMAVLPDGPRDVYRRRIFCDLKHPEIINEIDGCAGVMPGGDKAGFVARKG